MKAFRAVRRGSFIHFCMSGFWWGDVCITITVVDVSIVAKPGNAWRPAPPDCPDVDSPPDFCLSLVHLSYIYLCFNLLLLPLCDCYMCKLPLCLDPCGLAESRLTDRCSV
jgi:hypothetical protein